MKALSLRLAAAAAILAVVLAPAASAKPGAGAKPSVLPLSAARAAGTGWHVTPVRRLGKRIGNPAAAAVNRLGTSVVVFASRHSLAVARRAAGASTFKVGGRIPANSPGDCPECQVYDLTALGNGRFLLVYTNGLRLLARGIDPHGRLRRPPHLLATLYRRYSIYALPLAAVESDASRAVVVWGVNNDLGTNIRVEAAIDDRAGWSSSHILYGFTGPAPPAGLFALRLVRDDQDRFLVSLHGSNGDTTAAMWGLPAGSRQWETVTPPQVAVSSTLDPTVGAKLASVNGTITAAWQDASAALVVSTWDGASWSSPVTAVPAGYSNGHPVAVYPFFVSDGSRAALVWPDLSNGLDGPIEATVRVTTGGTWSAPLALPHSAADFPWGGFASEDTFDTFWFTPSGALAGVWPGAPNGLYLGSVSTTAASATTLSRTQTNKDLPWFVLPRAHGLHTIVWAERGHRFSATATTNGVLRHKAPLPGCGAPGLWASNPEASAQVVAIGLSGDAKCPSLLLW